MNRWIKHFLIYGSGGILLNAIPFFLIPIYTRAVSPSEYGVLELLNRSQDFLLLMIPLGLGSALSTLYQMESTRRGKLDLYSTALCFLGTTSLVIITLLMLLASNISGKLFATPTYSVLVVMFLLASYFEIVFQVAVLYLQSELRSSIYVSVFIFRALLSLLLNSVFAFALHLGIIGIAWATLIHTFFAAAVALFYTINETGLRFRADLMKRMLRFGLPLVPGAIAMFVLNNGDRYFLNAYATKADVGVYSIGYKIAAATTTLILVPFLKLWSVKMVDVSSRADGPEQIGAIATYLTSACLFATLAISLFGPYMLAALTTNTYAGAFRVIPIVGLAYVLFAWTVIMDTSFYVTHRTELKPVALITSCMVILPAYAILIRHFGMMGAAWATLVGFTTFAVITHLVSQRVYRTKYEYGRMGKILILAISLFALSRLQASSTFLNVTFRTILLCGFAAFLWSGKVSRPPERAFVLQQLNMLKSRIALI